jgi:hypothetical protein
MESREQDMDWRQLKEGARGSRVLRPDRKRTMVNGQVGVEVVLGADISSPVQDEASQDIATIPSPSPSKPSQK